MWSPTIHHRAPSDSGSTAAEERLSRIDKYLRDGGKTSPIHKTQPSTAEQTAVIVRSGDGQNHMDNYDQPPCESIEPEAMVDKSLTAEPRQPPADHFSNVSTSSKQFSLIRLSA